MENSKNSGVINHWIEAGEASEPKRSVFDFLSQVMTVFAFAVLVLNISCLLFGNGAGELSAIFALGGQGIPAGIIFQFFAVSVLVVGIRFVFLSDRLTGQMPGWLRILCMLTLIFLVIVAFVICFHWFPVGQGAAWGMFLLCYVVSFMGSTLISLLKIRTENKKLEEALQRLKKEEKK